MKNVTDLFIEYLLECGNNHIPDTVYAKAESCLIDYIGVTYIGAKENGELFRGTVQDSSGKCSVLGSDIRTNAGYAAIINGFHAHTMELDDGHRFGMIHLGAVIISAVLAVAQERSLPYKQFLKGIVMGYEAAVRLAAAMQPGHKKKGFHTTGTCGTIGAAAGIAFALGYNELQLKTTISAAATSASGLLEIQENISLLKPYNAAHGAMAGVMAAYVGENVFLHGPDDILGGNRGMLYLLSDTVSVDKLIEKENYYEIERIYVKPYAACRHCHPAMEAAIELSREFQISYKDIQKIEVYTYALAVKGHDHKMIKNIPSAKLSMPYSVAAAYILKSGGLEAFNMKNICREEILALTQKINIIEKEDFSRQTPKKRIAEVVLYGHDGVILKKRVDYAKGDPENPMSKQEVIEKFKMLMALCEEKCRADQILKLLEEKDVNSEALFKII